MEEFKLPKQRKIDESKYPKGVDRWWKCLECQKFFINHRPACNDCKSEGLPSIHPVATIHWLRKNPEGPIQGLKSKLCVACMPFRPTLLQIHASHDIMGVNCPKCMATEQYKREMDEFHRLYPDVSLELDLTGAFLLR